MHRRLIQQDFGRFLAVTVGDARRGTELSALWPEASASPDKPSADPANNGRTWPLECR